MVHQSTGNCDDTSVKVIEYTGSNASRVIWEYPKPRRKPRKDEAQGREKGKRNGSWSALKKRRQLSLQERQGDRIEGK
jgi:hypothetical protein